MHDKRRYLLLCTSVFAISPLIATAAPTYTLTNMGLTGAVYYNPVSATAVIHNVNGLAQVDGIMYRGSSSDPDGLGQDAWFFDGNATQQIGLIGSVYSPSTPNGVVESSSPEQLNTSGEASGISLRNGGGYLGQDTFFFNGTTSQQVGLTDSNYSYAITSGPLDGTYEYSSPTSLNDAGEVVGYANRYGPTGWNLGQDAWIFDGTSTYQIGYTGTGYSSDGGTYQYSAVTQISDTGEAIGYSNLYTGATKTGSDAWLYTSGSLVHLGLIGAQYGTGTANESSTVQQMNNSGEVIGSSTLVTIEGSDAWLYDGSMTRQISLGGFTNSAGQWETNTPTQLTNSGKVMGITHQYSLGGYDLGQYSWMYNGKATQQIGLTGAGYTTTTSTGGTYEYSSPSFVNEAGDVVGYSDIYGTSTGDNTWYFNGTSTQRIGLIGPAYDRNNGSFIYHSDGVTQLNSAGDVIGLTEDFAASGAGYGGWFFDPTTGITYPLDFSASSADGLWSTTPEYLTDSGLVFGNYDLYSGTTDLGPRGFVWSEADGFEDLGALVDGGLASAGWTNIQLTSTNPSGVSMVDGYPQYLIVAEQIGNRFSTKFDYGELSLVVPEPAAGLPLLLCAFLAKRRNH